MKTVKPPKKVKKRTDARIYIYDKKGVCIAYHDKILTLHALVKWAKDKMD